VATFTWTGAEPGRAALLPVSVREHGPNAAVGDPAKQVLGQQAVRPDGQSHARAHTVEETGSPAVEDAVDAPGNGNRVRPVSNAVPVRIDPLRSPWLIALYAVLAQLNGLHDAGSEKAGFDEGHIDAEGSDLAPQDLAQRFQRALRRRVVSHERQTDRRISRADIDDVRSRLVPHGRQDSLDHAERAEIVRLEYRHGLLQRDLFECAFKPVPRVVDQGIDPTGLFQNCPYAGLDRFVGTHIQWNQAPASWLFMLLWVTAGPKHDKSVFGQVIRDGLPDACRCTGDENDSLSAHLALPFLIQNHETPKGLCSRGSPQKIPVEGS